MTKEEFYKDIYDTYKKFGYINRSLLVNQFKDYNVGWQLSKYNGLKNICKEIGIEYSQSSKISKIALQEDFLRVYREQHMISTEIYSKYGKYSVSAIKSHFGGINSLMKILNIPMNTTRNSKREDIISDFLQFYSKYKSTSSTLYRKHGKYSQSVIERTFSSWSNFIKEIGLKPICEKIGKDKMLNDVKSIYEEYGFLSAKLINDNCEFTYQALSRYCSMEEISKECVTENAFVKFQSTGSKALYSILCDIYGKDDVCKEYSEPWLINPHTGKRMYIDFFLKQENIAIEFDGLQHYKYVEFIHHTYKQFFEQVYRDRIKEKLSLKHNIKTIRFRYDEKITLDFVKEKLSYI